MNNVILGLVGLLALTGRRGATAHVGGRMDITITPQMRQEAMARLWPAIMQRAPQPKRRRTQGALQAGLAWFQEHYGPESSDFAAPNAYSAFRGRNLTPFLGTPEIRRFFLGVLGRMDDMIWYEHMKRQGYARRKKSWGRRGPPPIVSENDPV